jgi:hypothetical protein
MVQSQPGQIVLETLSGKIQHAHTKKYWQNGKVAQTVERLPSMPEASVQAPVPPKKKKKEKKLRLKMGKSYKV